jgi:hypothetical protein
MPLHCFKYAKKKKNKKPFRLVEANFSRIVWRGVLPRTPLSTHFLYCQSLSISDRHGLLPEKRFRFATHEIRMGFRLNLGSRPLSLLYLAQYDFSNSNGLASYAASKVTTAIAEKLQHKNTDLWVILRSDPEFWSFFIEREFKKVNGGEAFSS